MDELVEAADQHCSALLTRPIRPETIEANGIVFAEYALFIDALSPVKPQPITRDILRSILCGVPGVTMATIFYLACRTHAPGENRLRGLLSKKEEDDNMLLINAVVYKKELDRVHADRVHVPYYYEDNGPCDQWPSKRVYTSGRFLVCLWAYWLQAQYKPLLYSIFSWGARLIAPQIERSVVKKWIVGAAGNINASSIEQTALADYCVYKTPMCVGIRSALQDFEKYRELHARFDTDAEFNRGLKPIRKMIDNAIYTELHADVTFSLCMTTVLTYINLTNSAMKPRASNPYKFRSQHRLLEGDMRLGDRFCPVWCISRYEDDVYIKTNTETLYKCSSVDAFDVVGCYLFLAKTAYPDCEKIKSLWTSVTVASSALADRTDII